jgi:hypothetical protein
MTDHQSETDIQHRHSMVQLAIQAGFQGDDVIRGAALLDNYITSGAGKNGDSLMKAPPTVAEIIGEFDSARQQAFLSTATGACVTASEIRDSYLEKMAPLLHTMNNDPLATPEQVRAASAAYRRLSDQMYEAIRDHQRCSERLGRNPEFVEKYEEIIPLERSKTE